MTAPRITSGGVREVGPVIRGFAALAGRVMGTQDPQVFLVLGRTRRLFWGWLLFAGGLMPGGTLPRRETELVILRVAALTGCDYERSHHERLGRRAGLTTDELAAVVTGPADPSWSTRDRRLLAAVDELHAKHDLSDATWEELRTELDERRAVEFLLLAGHYEMLATTLTTLRVQPDPPRRRR
ncbi:MAG TPA: carboxymuconolactone decarboxylase family protein [Nocardioidaceae bacterium]|nr:carboxymuconolactone decarboxylase family protein [Nocardioidaceae bacterium]